MLAVSPSAQTSIRWILDKTFAVTHVLLSLAHVDLWSPVGGAQWSEKLLKGMLTVTNSLVGGMVKLVDFQQPRDSGIEPPPSHEYLGSRAPDANASRYPL